MCVQWADNQELSEVTGIVVLTISRLTTLLFGDSNVRPYTYDNVYVRWAHVILPYVNRTLTSIYDENKLCVSYLQPKFTKVSVEHVIDSRKTQTIKTSLQVGDKSKF